MRNRLVILLSSIALILIFYLLLVCKLDSYREYLRFRLHPLEEYRLASETGIIQNGFWIIGDSRAADWKIEDLDFIGIPTCNLGIRGQTSKQVLERFRNDLEESRPHCILVQVGINDLKSIGLLEDGSITQNCILNIVQILEHCKKQDINAICSSIFLPGDIEFFRRPFWESGTVDSLMRVNEAIRVYCRENGFMWFDANELLENQETPGAVLKSYQADFLHINKEGYQRISEGLRILLSTAEEEWVEYILN
jgi:lysophospholipase L1-like esterase